MLRLFTRIESFLPSLPYGLLLLVVAVQAAFILTLNGGIFTYTLDDPYIHLALADHIFHGAYAINSGENAAPSSSILWPFLLVPFAETPFFTWVPLFYNGLFLALYLGVAHQAMRELCPDNVTHAAAKRAGLMALLMVITNVPGVLFSGMEHGLQLWLTMLVALGILREIRTGALPVWCVIALIAGPLVRYENTAVSLFAEIYFFIRGHRKAALLAFTAMVALMVSFSLFLLSQGLSALPSSVLAKLGPANMTDTKGVFTALAYGIFRAVTLKWPGGPLLFTFIITLIIGAVLFFWRKPQDKIRYQLCLYLMMVASAHLLFGHYNWCFRYMNYVSALALPLTVYIVTGNVRVLLFDNARLRGSMALLLLIFAIFVGNAFRDSYLHVPIGANNIYQQQYQMRRFVFDYYKKPVGINDLGLISLHNPSYVLDYVGLASEEARVLYRQKSQKGWMDALAKKRGVGLVMIYDWWFKGEVPVEWVKIGTLRISRSERMNLGGKEVAFYQTPYETDPESVRKQLAAFRKTLPEGVKFDFFQDEPLN